MIAVGNDELGAVIPVNARVKCGRPKCRVANVSHEIVYALSDATHLLAFYDCGKHSYLCGVAGRLLSGEELADDE